MALGVLTILSLVKTKKNYLYRVLDYHSIYPDVFGDADSIPSPLPPIITAEVDVQTTPGAISSALASLSENGPISPRSYAEEIQQLTDACHAFLVQIQQKTTPWVVQRYNYIYGPMPTDPTHFSYWMAMVSLFFSLLSMFGHARSCALQARNGMSVRAQSLIETNLHTGPADRRYGKGQTFTSEIAVASSSVSSALDRAIEQSLVRRRACHDRRTHMRMESDAFALGGSRMAALFHDTFVRRTPDVRLQLVRHVVSWCAHRHAGQCKKTVVPLVALSVLLAYYGSLHPISLMCFSAKKKQDDNISPFSFFLFLLSTPPISS